MEQIRKESLATELAAILYIQKKPFLFIFWLVFLLFIVYAVLAPNRYLAEGTLLVKAKNLERSVNALDYTSYGGLVQVSEADVYTEAETFSSKETLTETARRLIKKGDFKIKTDAGVFSLLKKTQSEQESIDNLAKQIKGALTIEVLPKTKIIHPALLWNDPKKATEILKTLMWTYLEQRQGIQNPEEGQDYLQEKVDFYLLEWKNKKLALAKLVEKYNAPDPNLEITNNLLLKKDYLSAINELEKKRDFLKTEVEILERTVNDGQNHLYSFLDNDTVTTLVRSLQDSQKEKEEVEKIFLSKRPEVRDANEVFQNSYKTIRGEAVLLLQHNKAALKTTHESLAAFNNKLQKLEERNVALKKISIQMDQMQMESALMASSFDVFYKRRDESRLKGYLQANVAIMSHAKADVEPAKPARIQLAVLGLFLSLTLSLVVAFILDAIDQTIKTPRDVENYLHAPVIFSIEDMGESYKKVSK